MLEGQGLALVSSALPAAVSTGGGEQYADNSAWSAEVLNEFNLGLGFEEAGGGKFRYGNLDTFRLGKTTLAQKRIDLTGLMGDAYFTNYNGQTYAVSGTDLFRLDGLVWTNIGSIGAGDDATGIEAFDGWFHIPRGPSTLYTAVNILTPATVMTGPYTVDVMYSAGGFLYAAQGNQVFYTAGSGTDCITPAPTPGGWTWVGIDLGPCDNLELITGIQHLYLGSLGQSRLFVSTTRQLYMILPGDIPVGGLLSWPTVGTDMTTHQNELYIPVGNGLARYSPSGSTFQVGLDQNFGLPADKFGPVLFMESTPRGLMAAVRDTVYAYNGEGWRYIVVADGDITGMHYDVVDDTLIVTTVTNSYKVALKPYDGQAASGPYELTGYLDTGNIFGGLRLLTKDWHEIVINGDFPSGTSVMVEYTTDGITYTTLGTATSDATTLAWACNGDTRPSARVMRLRVTLTTTDENITPVLEGLVIRYLPYVTDTARWTYSFTLPKDCLLDACKNPIAGYNQTDWDCAIRNAIAGTRPVPMVDYDGRSYSVAVTDWNYRLSNREFVDGAISFDKVWTLQLLETCGDGIGCNA